MSIAIREMTLSDHVMVDELSEAVSADLGKVARDVLAPGASGSKAFLADTASFMFGAYADHDVVGGLWGARVRHPSGALSYVGREVHVLTHARRRGIGTLLVESAIAMARRHHARSFDLQLSAAVNEADGTAEFLDRLGSSPGAHTHRWQF